MDNNRNSFKADSDLTPPPAINDTPLTLNSQPPPEIKLDNSQEIPLNSSESENSSIASAPSSMPQPTISGSAASSQPDLSNINPVFNPQANASSPVNQPVHQASSMPHLESEQPVKESNTQPKYPNDQPKRSFGKVAAILLVLLLAGLTTAGVYYWLQQNSQDYSKQESVDVLNDAPIPSPQVSPTPTATSNLNLPATASAQLPISTSSPASNAPVVLVNPTTTPSPSIQPQTTPVPTAKEVDLPEAGDATASIALVAGGLMVIFLGLLSLSLI